MGVLLHAWQPDPQGGLRRAIFDSDAIPAGWYDAPDKVPGVRAAEAAAPTVAPEPAPSRPVHGEPAKRGPGRPRK